MATKSDFWDERYSVNEYVYGEHPNSYLKEQLEIIPIGSILFVGEGEGRNGVYAAKLGWKVFAYDLSVEGKRKAENLARKYNVEIDYYVGELHELDFQKDQFDVIALIFTHFLSKHRAAIHKELTKHLRPGGTLIMEVFSQKQISHQVEGDSGGGPKSIDMLYGLLKELNQEHHISIVLVTHHIDESCIGINRIVEVKDHTLKEKSHV